MGTAQDDGIHATAPHLVKIASRNTGGDVSIKMSLFHQRHKEGTTLGKDLYLWVKPFNLLFIGPTLNGRTGPQDPNPAGAGQLKGLMCPRLHNPNKGNFKMAAKGRQTKAGRGVAGDNAQFDLESQQELNNLTGEADNSFLRLRSIGKTGGIAKVDNVLIGEKSLELFYNT